MNFIYGCLLGLLLLLAPQWQVGQRIFIASNIPSGYLYAGHFDGTTDYVTTASVSTLSPPALSESAWIYISGLPSAYNTVIGSNGGQENIFVKSNGKLSVNVVGTGGTAYVDGTGIRTLTIGNWYFLSLTYDSVSGVHSYVNGVLDGSAAANGTLVTGTNPTTIGYQVSSTPRYWQGLISGVTMYNVALTSTQIGTLYANGAISSGLIGQWKLNEGSGTTAIDSSTGGNNGTWVGTASGNSGYYQITH